MAPGLLLLFWLCASTVFAQQPEAKVKKLTLTPAAAPVPALRYRLLPEVRGQKPGNAALLYQRAHSPEWYGPLQRDKEFVEGLHDWLEGPLEKFPRDKAKRLLAHRGLLQEIDFAARREYCQWELTDRIAKEGLAMLLPDVQSFRTYAALLALRSRMALAEGKFDDAVHSLQTGFALGRHVAESPLLITGLVGIAISSITTEQTETWSQVPGAPNLYWALTDLPQPLISMRLNFQGERLMIDSVFPEVRTTLTNPKGPPIPLDRLTAGLDQLQLAGGGTEKVLGMAWITLKVYPAARKYLIEQGRTEQQVEVLGTPQAVAMFLVAQYDQFFDDMAKWLQVPYWQAVPGLRKIEADLKSAHKDRREETLLATLLLPAAKKVMDSRVRLDRRIALLRTLEALRLHGKLPAKFDDVSVPVPLDPATGQPFAYRLEQDHAVLTVPPLPDTRDAETRYEIRLAAKK